MQGFGAHGTSMTSSPDPEMSVAANDPSCCSVVMKLVFWLLLEVDLLLEDDPLLEEELLPEDDPPPDVVDLESDDVVALGDAEVSFWTQPVETTIAAASTRAPMILLNLMERILLYCGKFWTNGAKMNCTSIYVEERARGVRRINNLSI